MIVDMLRRSIAGCLMVTLAALVLPAHAQALCVIGMGNCVSANSILGKWKSLRDERSMTITPLSIDSDDGQFHTSTAFYKIKDVEGRVIHVMMSTNSGRDQELTVEFADDVTVMQTRGPIDGLWKRFSD
jgi:hypothetical protein